MAAFPTLADAAQEKKMAKQKPGPKKGQKHSGQFTPVDSRRFGGDTPDQKTYRETFAALCQAKSLDAVDYLHNTMMDDGIEHRTRLRSASELLDRGFGKALTFSAVNVSGEVGGSAKALGDVGNMSDTQILKMLTESGALNANDSAIDAEFIELDDSK